MIRDRQTKPDFFEENPVDPIKAVTGSDPKTGAVALKKNIADTKRKAGFYLSIDILERFNRKFYELKLAGVSIENKSALMALALSFALDDMDKGGKSRLLKQL
jgi:hypothetical protein